MHTPIPELAIRPLTPQPRRHRRTRITVLLWSSVSLLALSVAACVVFALTPTTPRLSATVECDGAQLSVSNTGTVDWRDVHITINGRYHEEPIDVIKARHVVEGVVLSFADSRGNRFPADKKAVMEVKITATTPEGTGVFRWRRQK
jgi:hypothetical protein